MNALFIASRFAHLAVADRPLTPSRLNAQAVVAAPTERRNRYAKRSFGVGYGSSHGYAKARTYLDTRRLSRYR